MSPEQSHPEGQFDPNYLKGLADSALVEALLDDARYATTKLDGQERERTETQLMNICWVLDEEEQADLEEWQEGVADIFKQLSSAILEATTEDEVEPEEAPQELFRRVAGHNLELIERHQQEIEKGLKTKDERFSTWTEGSTAFALQGICALQSTTGINMYGDYVRETALSSIIDAGYRGVTLLRNALAGDEASYQLGLDALQQGVDKENLSWDTAIGGVGMLTRLLQTKEPTQHKVLRDLAVDVLTKMRGWMGIPGNPAYTYNYVFATANLAVTLRNQQQDQEIC
jgi:hypothetical protein